MNQTQRGEHIFEHTIQSYRKHMSTWCAFQTTNLVIYDSNLGEPLRRGTTKGPYSLCHLSLLFLYNNLFPFELHQRDRQSLLKSMLFMLWFMFLYTFKSRDCVSIGQMDLCSNMLPFIHLRKTCRLYSNNIQNQAPGVGCKIVQYLIIHSPLRTNVLG